MKEAIRLSAALSLVCCVAAAVLAIANHQTKAAIRATELREKVEALRYVLPEFDNEPLQDTFPADAEAFEAAEARFYRATRGGSVVGLAGEGRTGSGFGGELRVLVGLNPDATIRTVIVTAHKETPGLGTVATDRKQKRTLRDLLGSEARDESAGALAPCKYLDQLAGMGLQEPPALNVTQDGGVLDAVSGATVSSRAIASAVRAVAEAFKSHRTELLAASGGEG